MTTPIDPAGKLLAHLPRLSLLQSGGIPTPINCELDLSNRCSLGCRWCHFAFTHVRGPLAGKVPKPTGAIPGGDLMDVTLAKSIIDQLVGMGTSLTITGGGEPTLHPHFDEIVAYGEAHGLKQSIYTHGGHLGEGRAALLKRALTFVYVSLDAAGPVAYKRDKGVDRFQAACDGISRLVAAEGDAAVGVGYLVTEQNWRQARDAVVLAKRLGADYIQFRPTILYDQQMPDRPAEDRGWLPAAVAELELIQEEWGEFTVCDIGRFRMYQDWSGHGYATCWWSTLQTCVTPNGKVWTCVNKREHPGAEIGDLSVESFAEVWGRHSAAKVNGDCRVLCRGHIPNIALDEMLRPRDHPEFV